MGFGQLWDRNMSRNGDEWLDESKCGLNNRLLPPLALTYLDHSKMADDVLNF